MNKYPWGTRSVLMVLGVKKKNVLGASRTRNRLLRKQVLYPLSYEDVTTRLAILTPFCVWVKPKFNPIYLICTQAAQPAKPQTLLPGDLSQSEIWKVEMSRK